MPVILAPGDYARWLSEDVSCLSVPYSTRSVSDARVRNHGHSDNRAARGIDPMITLGSDREIGAAALAKARDGVPVATIPR